MRSNIIGKIIHIFFLSLFKFQYRLNTQNFYKIFFILTVMIIKNDLFTAILKLIFIISLFSTTCL
jgi:hypothetical protein